MQRTKLGVLYRSCTVLYEHTLHTVVLVGVCPTKSTDNATETTIYLMIVPS